MYDAGKFAILYTFCDIVYLIMKAHPFLKVCAFGLVALAISSNLGAQPATQSTRDSTARDPNSVQPERPTVATHAGTVARGWMELEEGGEWDKASNGERSLFAPINLKIGLASRAQLNVLVNLITDPGPGTSLAVGDFTFGVKYRIVEDAPIIGDFAILPAIKLPWASEINAGTGTTDFSLLLVSSHQLGSVSMDLNVGQTWRSGDGTSAPKMASLWTASFGFPIEGPLGAVAEVFGYPRTTGPAGAKGTTAFLVGPTYLVRKWLALDAGIIVPIAGDQAHAIYAGFVWNLGCAATKNICRE
jgi:hypothetical protein